MGTVGTPRCDEYGDLTGCGQGRQSAFPDRFRFVLVLDQARDGLVERWRLRSFRKGEVADLLPLDRSEDESRACRNALVLSFSYQEVRSRCLFGDP